MIWNSEQILGLNDVPTTMNRKMMVVTANVMNAGTKKAHPQGELGVSVLAQNEGMNVPRMFPSGVCAYQRPRIKPRLLLGSIEDPVIQLNY